MTKLIALAKKMKALLKKVISPQKPFLSFSRRIERVKTDEKVCAMTFDDGPFSLPCAPDNFGGRCLTDVLLDTLEKYGAHASFDVVGSTAENYPDECGKAGTPQWGGEKYDHYPEFGKDDKGGAAACPELIRRIIAGGHQITNHGYRHIIFGKKSVVYGGRVHMEGIGQVMEDLRRLDGYMADTFGYRMTMARPPHYVDRIDGGYTSYDAYSGMGYMYMAASFDGAGWLPLESYEKEVAAMTEPIKKALQADENFFCGQIIFQKDGYNMAMRTPVAAALDGQLKLLTDSGYKVVSVEELMEYSPFADCGKEDGELFEKLVSLAKKRIVAYSDNRVRLDGVMTNEAFALLFWGREDDPLTNKRRTAKAMALCAEKGLLPAGSRAGDAFCLKMTGKARGLFEREPENTTRRAFYGALDMEKLENI